jgi:hypothetical protein
MQDPWAKLLCSNCVHAGRSFLKPRTTVTETIRSNRELHVHSIGPFLLHISNFCVIVTFIQHVQNVPTNKDYAFPVLHTLQFTTAYMSSQPAVSSSDFWQRFPTVDLPFAMDSRTLSVLQVQKISNDS